MVGVGVAEMTDAATTSSADTLRAGRPTVVLASASSGRLSVLRNAGIDPVVVVSGVDEEAVVAALADSTEAEVVAALAVAKAEAVLDEVAERFRDAIVIGCDSMLLVDGRLIGKPHTPEAAALRWHAQSGHVGDLLTGQAVIRVSSGDSVARAVGTAVTTVHFAAPTPDELDAYLASGEPLEVAGAFTIDGLGGWFVDRIEGDPSCVIGLSLPLMRRLLADVGLAPTDLWRRS
jgi:septum formation protein